MLRRLAPAFACAVLTLTPTPTAAQFGWHTTWTLGALGGAARGGDLREPAPTFGGTLAARWKSGLALEAEVFHVADLGPDAARRTSLLTAGGTILYHLPLSPRLVSYGALGGAYARFRPGDAEMAGTFGAGLEVRAGRRAALRGDARYVHINDAPNFWRVTGGLIVFLR